MFLDEFVLSTLSVCFECQVAAVRMEEVVLKTSKARRETPPNVIVLLYCQSLKCQQHSAGVLKPVNTEVISRKFVSKESTSNSA